MRLRIVLALLVLSGCAGVSQQQFREQSVRLQQVEARASELEGLLTVERAAKTGVEDSLIACRELVERLDRELSDAQQVGNGLRGRLAECERREEAVMADLDLSRRSGSAGAVELAGIRGEHERARNDWAEREKELLGTLEGARGENATLQAEIHLLLEEKARVEREKREKLEEISQTYEGLLEGMREQVEQGKVTISNLRGQLSVKLQEEILFDSGSSVVKPAGRELLAEIAAVVREISDRGVLVGGHTDDVPIRGSLRERFATNWELSAARAISVVRYLQEVGGVEPQRLSAAGYGEYRPAVPNDGPENRARNRRIELQLVSLETMQEESSGETGEVPLPQPGTSTPGEVTSPMPAVESTPERP